jgi:molecular chaperone GrpE
VSSTSDRPERDEPIVITDKRKLHGDHAASGSHEGAKAAPPPDASTDQQLLAERTADLQRVQAEYANYRKRADRERLAAGEAAIGRALVDFLPVLDNIDRAREHGDLTGGLKAIADQLDGIFAKLGLAAFGEVGDPFDPAIHEAVMHDESDAVTDPTCTKVLRPGYKHGDRLLRPAMVGVTDPVHPVHPTPATDTDSADHESPDSEKPDSEKPDSEKPDSEKPDSEN